MQCRHTVPDWHRYVDPTTDAPPILAACRLLVKEGERASVPRSIACGYWGHQRDCPLYDGPGAAANSRTGRIAWPASTDVPVSAAAVWPVRTPAATDGMRVLIIGLGVLSIALLLWAALLGLSVLSGKATPAGHLQLILVAATVSILTHILVTLRMWARR